MFVVLILGDVPTVVEKEKIYQSDTNGNKEHADMNRLDTREHYDKCKGENST